MIIAFLGLGSMGSRMAANLAKAGYDVVVWNRDPAKSHSLARRYSVKVTDTIRDAVSEADVVFTMVRDVAASRSVWVDPLNGALNAMKPNSIAVECSTLTPEWTRELFAEAQRHHVLFVDAPVAGSRPQAEQAQLIFMTGADDESLAILKPMFLAMGSQVLQTGDAGSAMTVKLAVNALLAIEAAAVAEMLGYLKSSNIQLNKAIDVIGATSVASPAIKGLAATMIAENFAPQFPVELMAKDLDYLKQSANGTNAALPLCDAAIRVAESAIRSGFGDDHISGFAKLY